MSEVKTKKKGWPKIGTLRRGEAEDGKPASSYIKLEEGVEILINGVKVPMNEKRTVRLDDPRKTVEKLRDGGHISEADADKRLEKLSENQWLRYELILPPPRT